jgi:hypothetical protein
MVITKSDCRPVSVARGSVAERLGTPAGHHRFYGCEPYAQFWDPMLGMLI